MNNDSTYNKMKLYDTNIWNPKLFRKQFFRKKNISLMFLSLLDLITSSIGFVFFLSGMILTLSTGLLALFYSNYPILIDSLSELTGENLEALNNYVASLDLESAFYILIVAAIGCFFVFLIFFLIAPIFTKLKVNKSLQLDGMDPVAKYSKILSLNLLTFFVLAPIVALLFVLNVFFIHFWHFFSFLWIFMILYKFSTVSTSIRSNKFSFKLWNSGKPEEILKIVGTSISLYIVVFVIGRLYDAFVSSFSPIIVLISYIIMIGLLALVQGVRVMIETRMYKVFSEYEKIN